jgi:type II secretory pathway pseudopilin PulG
MPRQSNVIGFTLLELLLVLTLMSAALLVAVPNAMQALDVFSVHAAREALITASSRTRSLAISRNGAQLQIDAQAGTLTLIADSSTIKRWSLRELYGVTLTIEHSARTVVEITYDHLGIGRLANLTLRVARGRVEGGVTFSAYGRPRAW